MLTPYVFFLTNIDLKTREVVPDLSWNGSWVCLQLLISVKQIALNISNCTLKKNSEYQFETFYPRISINLKCVHSSKCLQWTSSLDGKYRSHCYDYLYEAISSVYEDEMQGHRWAACAIHRWVSLWVLENISPLFPSTAFIGLKGGKKTVIILSQYYNYK